MRDLIEQKNFTLEKDLTFEMLTIL